MAERKIPTFLKLAQRFDVSVLQLNQIQRGIVSTMSTQDLEKIYTAILAYDSVDNPPQDLVKQRLKELGSLLTTQEQG